MQRSVPETTTSSGSLESPRSISNTDSSPPLLPSPATRNSELSETDVRVVADLLSPGSSIRIDLEALRHHLVNLPRELLAERAMGVEIVVFAAGQRFSALAEDDSGRQDIFEALRPVVRLLFTSSMLPLELLSRYLEFLMSTMKDFGRVRLSPSLLILLSSFFSVSNNQDIASAFRAVGDTFQHGPPRASSSSTSLPLSTSLSSAGVVSARAAAPPRPTSSSLVQLSAAFPAPASAAAAASKQILGMPISYVQLLLASSPEDLLEKVDLIEVNARFLDFVLSLLMLSRKTFTVVAMSFIGRVLQTSSHIIPSKSRVDPTSCVNDWVVELFLGVLDFELPLLPRGKPSQSPSVRCLRICSASGRR